MYADSMPKPININEVLSTPETRKGRQPMQLYTPPCARNQENRRPDRALYTPTRVQEKRDELYSSPKKTRRPERPLYVPKPRRTVEPAVSEGVRTPSPTDSILSVASELSGRKRYEGRHRKNYQGQSFTPDGSYLVERSLNNQFYRIPSHYNNKSRGRSKENVFNNNTNKSKSREHWYHDDRWTPSDDTSHKQRVISPTNRLENHPGNNMRYPPHHNEGSYARTYTNKKYSYPTLVKTNSPPSRVAPPLQESRCAEQFGSRSFPVTSTCFTPTTPISSPNSYCPIATSSNDSVSSPSKSIESEATSLDSQHNGPYTAVSFSPESVASPSKTSDSEASPLDSHHNVTSAAVSPVPSCISSDQTTIPSTLTTEVTTQLECDTPASEQSIEILSSPSASITTSQSSNSPVTPDKESSNSKYVTQGAFESEKEVPAIKVEPLFKKSWTDVDEWETFYDNSNPEKVQEVEMIPKPKLAIQPTSGNYQEYRNESDEADGNLDRYKNVIEIYDFSPSLTTRDMMSLFNTCRGIEIKWVDDTHCLGIFETDLAAAEMLDIKHPMLKTRPLSEGIQRSKEKALRCTDGMMPAKDRPKTSAFLARRMVTGALGMKIVLPKEIKEAERRKLKEAREIKKRIARLQDDAWEGTLENQVQKTD